MTSVSDVMWPSSACWPVTGDPNAVLAHLRATGAPLLHTAEGVAAWREFADTVARACVVAGMSAPAQPAPSTPLPLPPPQAH